MKLIVAHRAGVPLVNMTMLVDTGTAQDFASIAPGTSELAMAMLDEGTHARTGPQLVDALGNLGATLNSGGAAEYGAVSLSALTSTLGAGTRALRRGHHAARVPAEGSRPPQGADPRRHRRHASRIPSAPPGACSRDSSSAPTAPMAVIATPESVSSIDRAQVVAFHERWFHPQQRDADRRRRHHARAGQAAGRGGLRQLEVRAGPADHRARHRRRDEASRLSARPPGTPQTVIQRRAGCAAAERRR